MIKNLVFDIGGIIIDDSVNNIAKILNIDCDKANKIYKMAFGKEFKECMKGNISLDNHLKSVIKNNQEYTKELNLILTPENFPISIPLYSDTIDLIKKLHGKYNIYFLSNIVKESYEYLKPILNEFDGGIYSFKEGCVKPEKEIYLKLIDKFKLKKEETLFFDDRSSNINSANYLGIKGILYIGIETIKNNIKEEK